MVVGTVVDGGFGNSDIVAYIVVCDAAQEEID